MNTTYRIQTDPVKDIITTAVQCTQEQLAAGSDWVIPVSQRGLFGKLVNLHIEIVGPQSPPTGLVQRLCNRPATVREYYESIRKPDGCRECTFTEFLTAIIKNPIKGKSSDQTSEKVQIFVNTCRLIFTEYNRNLLVELKKKSPEAHLAGLCQKCTDSYIASMHGFEAYKIHTAHCQPCLSIFMDTLQPTAYYSYFTISHIDLLKNQCTEGQELLKNSISAKNKFASLSCYTRVVFEWKNRYEQAVADRENWICREDEKQLQQELQAHCISKSGTIAATFSMQYGIELEKL